MVENAHEAGDRQTGSNQQSIQASNRLLDASGAWSGPPSKLDGTQCKTGPENGGIPTLPLGRATKGCEYTPAEKAPGFLRDNFENAKDSLARIQTNVQAGTEKDSFKGSGVIMGHGKDVTYVGTVDHNTADYSDKPGPGMMENGKPIKRDGPIKVQMPDGKEYEARRAQLKGEDGTDRGVLIVHTGSETGKFKEAQFADQPNYKGKGFSVGFPGDATTPYASVFQAKGESAGDVRRGEPVRISENIGNSQPGMSGGPMYNERGQVFSVDDGNDNTPGKRYSSMFGIRFGKQEVERLKKQLPESW